jgi:hypothetical protein
MWVCQRYKSVSEVLILLDFKSFAPEVLVLKGLKCDFSEVLILEELRAETARAGRIFRGEVVRSRFMPNDSTSMAHVSIITCRLFE